MIHYSMAAARDQQPVGVAPFHRYLLEDGTVWTEFYRTGRGYLLRFPGLADFDVSADGAEVIAHPIHGTDPATVEHLYLNQLVPLALSRQERPAFHASVVAVPRGCVAFLGRTGAGKSTLAASFALSGAAFLTDDALIIDESQTSPLAMPSHASLRLWDDSVGALVAADTARADQVSYSDKARLLAGGALVHADAPAPLLAAYVLGGDNSSEITIRPLTGAERHLAWIQNSFLLDIADRELLARHFDWTHRIAARVPTFALDYPRDYGMLPEVRHAILLHAGKLEE